MLSTADLERLIAVKRREIEKEKTQLGLSPTLAVADYEDDKENTAPEREKTKPLNSPVRVVDENHERPEKEERDRDRSLGDLEENIPPDLERYIRRYVGLPVMLKAGEYSPNNPLIRGERTTGDALLGLGEYERRRNTLRKIRQQQYREYLDQQAKKKQEEKEKADRERREREEREREQEERERARLERERNTPERRTAFNFENVVVGTGNTYVGKVDTAVQVDAVSRPLSVAVQTDDAELYRLSPLHSLLTQAERELSPRTVQERNEKPHAATWDVNFGRRKSYGDYDERSSSLVKRTNRDKLVSDLRHTYMPSIFDADAIQLRNLQAEKEAAARRQFYQQELKNQILEQQRIREERKAREKMLEQAEMRRLEEQLRMLKLAQEREIGKQYEITANMKENATDYEKKRSALQKEIDIEQEALLRTCSQPNRLTDRRTHTSRSDKVYYPHIENKKYNDYSINKKRYSVNLPEATIDKKTYSMTRPECTIDKKCSINLPENSDKKPYSMNIPQNSIFSPNYDVDSYLRRNLNPTKETLKNHRLENLDHRVDENFEKSYDFDNYNLAEKSRETAKSRENIYSNNNNKNNSTFKTENVVVQMHDQPKERIETKNSKNSIPIPILRHSPKDSSKNDENHSLSDAMKIVDGKWQVPAVQKNILKSLPSDEGKNISILTQLGSIRRQLQLEQLKLDSMSKNNIE